MSVVFDLNQLIIQMEDFVDKAPLILKNNALTRDLAADFERIIEISENPFTLAIIGQMRVGKSTLINAIVGKALAAVDVNETTATINFFKYGDKNLENCFRVHWKDKPYEDFPLAEIEKWTGQSQRALQTKYIEFFSCSDLLRDIYIVDTPGTRSIIESHVQIINDFLAEKRERQTLQHGGKADAIVYVLGPVARDRDSELLTRFEQQTRLPGSSPFNSVAVIHKWETIETDDPIREASQKAAIIRDQLNKYVAKVIPVSGPFGMATQQLPSKFWQELADFISETDQNKLQRVLDRGERRFKTMLPEGAMLYEQSNVPWPCFLAMIKIGLQQKCTAGSSFREIIRNASGIDQLINFIKERFVDRKRFIKYTLLLKKTLIPCDKAIIRLDGNIKEKENLLHEARSCLEIIKSNLDRGGLDLKPVYKLLVNIQEPLERILESDFYTRNEIDHLSMPIKDQLIELNKDIKALRMIDDNRFDLEDKDLLEIRTVLGCFGQSADERIAHYRTDDASLLKIIESRIDFWNARTNCAAIIESQVYAQVTSRLMELADIFEVAN